MTQGKLLNQQTMIDLLGDDQESISEFRQQFLEQSELCLLQLEQFLLAEDFENLKLKAHFLKTSAKAIGAEISASELYRLEKSAVDGDVATSAIIIKGLFLLHDKLKVLING